MTRESHIAVETLGDVERAPESDPRRKHLAGCERCRAALAAYRAFLEPPTDLAEGERLAARARLIAARREAAPAPLRQRRHVWRPAWALAAAIVLAAGIYASTAGRRAADPGRTLRGPSGGRSEAGMKAGVDVLPPARRSDGTIVVRWRAVPRADFYQVTFFGPGLGVLWTSAAGRDTSLVLAAGEAAARAQGALYAQVTALHAGRAVARSRLTPLAAR